MFIKIYNEDCLCGLKKLDNECVDLVVTSPPYNLDLGNNKYNKNPYDLYNDNKEHKEYINWLKEIFGETYRILKNGGRICINIGDGKNGCCPTHSDIIQFMTHELNYILMTTIIWDKAQVSNRCSWGSFMSPSSPSFPTPFEYILVFAKDSKKLLRENNEESDLTKEEFISWSLSLWKFAPETKQKKFGHPAMFCEELPLRCIKMFSWANKNVTVLDMFSGAGTTAKVCKDLNRNFIGFEISENYMKISANRLNVENFENGNILLETF